MNEQADPRRAATREQALRAALDLLQKDGVLGVTHAAVHARTGISRSTLYRHWPKLNQLLNDAFLRAATPRDIAPGRHATLREDLASILETLVAALDETPWGRVAPQVVAAAAVDETAGAVIKAFQADRMDTVAAAFDAARDRGEIPRDAPVAALVQATIAVPYYRKLMAGLPLDKAWLEGHLDLLCGLAAGSGGGE